MGKDSNIGWTQNTWNPATGCHKVSEGCKFCYMYRDKERYGLDPNVVLKSKTNFDAPLKWKDPTLIFTCSWSDWFLEEIDEWRDDMWAIIKATPHHTYQILTKRPERISQCLPKDWGDGYDNVWLGFSAENQKTLEERSKYFFSLKAKVKFISIEPIIGKIDLSLSYIVTSSKDEPSRVDDLKNIIDWIIIGGESGNENGKYLYRPAELEWFSSLWEQCTLYKIPLFVKQMGTHLAKQMGLKDRHGADADEYPFQYLKTRQFPKCYTKPLVEKENAN